MPVTYRPQGAYPKGEIAKLYEANFKDLLGVHFMHNPYDYVSIDPRRSPDMVNMIQNSTGKTESRRGYVEVADLEAQINGIYEYDSGSAVTLLVHAGTKMYTWTTAGVTAEIASGLANARSVGWYLAGCLWVLDGTNFWRYDGTDFVTVASVAYIPTIAIACPPSGGGTAYEARNLLQPKFKQTFAGTSGDAIYHLNYTALDNTVALVVEVMNGSGVFETKTITTDYTVDFTAGTVTFGSPPGISPVAGADNIRITASKTVSGAADKINKCTIVSAFGMSGNTDHLFVSGNAAYPNFDWHSKVLDPTYFPDINYTQVGSANAAIMGYLRLDNATQIIVKQSGDASSVYYRTGVLDGDGNETFPLRQGNISFDVPSKYTLQTFIDDHMLLTDKGVLSIVALPTFTDERAVQQRSHYINERLLREDTLSAAVAAVYDKWYIIAVNNHMYLADSRRKTYEQDASPPTYQYEWFYFDNIPARCLFVHGGSLYFGSSSGALCRMYNESDPITDTTYQDGGENIKWRLELTCGVLGSISQTKKIKQMYVVVEPVNHSKYRMEILKSGVWTPITSGGVALEVEREFFDFSGIDFADFTFDTDATPRSIKIRMKTKEQYFAFRFTGDYGLPFSLYEAALQYEYRKGV